VRVEAYIEVLQGEGVALHLAAEAAGTDAAVPGCPGWTVAGLLEHVGLVHRWATGFVRDNRPGSFEDLEPPDSTDPLRWYLDGLVGLVTALRAAPADLDCWTFLPAASTPLEFWARRQAHETAIHRADAEAARGVVPDFAPAFAADGVDELVVTLLGEQGRRRLRAAPPRSLAIRPADAAGGWRLDLLPEGRRIGRDDGSAADCVIEGRASDLYLFLWNRRPASAPEVSGDRALAELWRSAVRMVR
jgi:uncharacterized protein (TIGR03083 family)